MAATIEDVARAAQVSTASVSRALRGQAGVSEVTRRRVQRIALELGYVVSPAASRLASGRTNCVAVVVPYIDRWFFAKAIGGAESVFREAGYDLLLYNLGDLAGRSRFFAEPPLGRRVDAVLVLCLPLTTLEIAALRKLSVPIGLIGSCVDGFIDVRIDDVSAAKAAVWHLINLGHRRIGLIGGEPDDPMGFTAPGDRSRGYRAALCEAGIPLDDNLAVSGDFTMAGGSRAMSKFLGMAEPPTAIFAESDEMAFGALRTLRQARIRVPERISIVGFDDHDIAELLDLTTVAQPVWEQGRRIASLLLEEIRSPGDTHTADSGLSTRLVIRRTTAPPRLDNPAGSLHAPLPNSASQT